LFHNQYTTGNYRAEAQMNRFQSTYIQRRPKLLAAGRVPLLLTTRVIPAWVVIDAEKQKSAANVRGTTADAAGALLLNSKAASSVKSESSLPGVKLLGKIKGGAITGEPHTPPGECRECRATDALERGETICPSCRLTARFDVLVKERKLSAAAWEKIRRVLCLPKKMKNMSKERAQAVFHLLNRFAERVSFDEQNAMTADALVTKLNGLPRLPKPFGKCVRAAAASAAHQSPEAAKRNSVSAAKFTEVAARQGCYCFWCGIKVVREAEIPAKNRISKNRSTVVYLSADGELREEAFGTIDHLVRVTDGGDNNPANLVISCYACNQEREVKTLAHNRPFARRRVPCGKCGGRFFHPDWGCCSICGSPPKPQAAESSTILFQLITIMTIRLKMFCSKLQRL
jgi:5-methylcytosine-specific restriction endonuclease McrA